jgi:hypothetical protein
VLKFLRPTRITWLVLVLPIVGAGIGLAVGSDAAFFAMFALAIELPFRLWRALGVPVGRRTDFWGWPDPSGPGLALIVLTDAIVCYVVASGVAAAWRALGRRARRERGGPRES